MTAADGAGAVAGRLAVQRLPGSSWAWTAAGAGTGAVIGALWLGSALLAHRRAHWVMTLLGGALVAWQSVAVVRSVAAPLDGVGRLAFAAWPRSSAVAAPGGVVWGAVVAGAAAVAALLALGSGVAFGAFCPQAITSATV